MVRATLVQNLQVSETRACACFGCEDIISRYCCAAFGRKVRDGRTKIQATGRRAAQEDLPSDAEVVPHTG